MSGPADELERSIRASIARGDLAAAATTAIRGHGPLILSYLRGVVRDEDLAGEAFARFGEELWKSLPGYRGESSLRTWCYAVAWGVVRHLRRDLRRRRESRLGTSEGARLADELRATSAPQRHLDATARLQRLRQQLSLDEQTLLILRVDRELPWKDVADILGAGGEPIDESSLRKRFERLKARLRKLGAAEGLLGSS